MPIVHLSVLLYFYPSIFYMSSGVMVFQGNVICSGREFCLGGHFNTGLVIFMTLQTNVGLVICRGITFHISSITVISGSTSFSAEESIIYSASDVLSAISVCNELRQ